VPHARVPRILIKQRRGYSPAQVAALLDKSVSWVHKILALGVLRSVKVCGCRIIPSEALDELLDVAQRPEPEPPLSPQPRLDAVLGNAPQPEPAAEPPRRLTQHELLGKAQRPQTSRPSSSPPPQLSPPQPRRRTQRRQPSVVEDPP
jgi:hypothetical protein